MLVGAFILQLIYMNNELSLDDVVFSSLTYSYF